ncbi:MAG: hypothetical protein HY401_03235 [Elusimicrobia bacterium]|nr:hypothetical protein [Elusimicrobiota bacterium]
MNCRGQILVPSLFVFPGLVLFAILIVEVAKLSQQKVLMQFAMDTSVFMEASQLSDAANRLAYLNSPWPTRVLQAKDDEFEVWRFDKLGSNSVCGKDTCFSWHYFLKNGVYPGSLDKPVAQQPSIYPSDDERTLGDTWQGMFRADVRDASAQQFLAQRNANNVPDPPINLGTWVLFTLEDIDRQPRGGLSTQVMVDDAKVLYASLIEVYTYFYQLASMVRLVYEKLNKVFFKKTFWLNTGFTPDGALAPGALTIRNHCTMTVTSWFTIFTSMGFPDARRWEPTPITAAGGQGRCGDESPNAGIWQLSTIPSMAFDNRERLLFGKYHYTGPGNHFGVVYRDLFEGFDPWVTASAEVSGGRIWPKPKPTFQVRLKP